MSEIIETLYEMEGVSKVQNTDNSGYYCLLVSSLRSCHTVTIPQIWVITFQMNAGEKAALIFGDLDVDGDGTVDEEEFIK